MSASNQPWDSGLQPERTALAWRRFSVALAVVGLGTLKALSGSQHGWLAMLTGGIVMVSAIVIGFHGIARYGASHRALHDSQPLPDGVLNAVAGAAVAALGLFAAVSILVPT